MASRILTPALGIVIRTSFATALAVFTALKLSPDRRRLPSPRETQILCISKEQGDALPYPPDILPGARRYESLRNDEGVRMGSRGPESESAVLMKSRSDYTVADVVQWQLVNHQGFTGSSVSSVMFSTVEGPRPLSRGLGVGTVLILAGEEDPVILAGQLREDAEGVMGKEKVDFRITPEAGTSSQRQCPILLSKTL
ncbi:hypothetical protein B2J93_841 [Marssonina coronariae]|uniref:Uncharacterized protein n=1 Tax=Diplocarpon coronariae TaxID=2795749 RepID=A0A218ZDW3_9HELO|nr:hypothetical protein B2J93_841 [Marssonina coronariae]